MSRSHLVRGLVKLCVDSFSGYKVLSILPVRNREPSCGWKDWVSVHFRVHGQLFTTTTSTGQELREAPAQVPLVLHLQRLLDRSLGEHLEEHAQVVVRKEDTGEKRDAVVPPYEQRKFLWSVDPLSCHDWMTRGPLCITLRCAVD